MIDMGLASMRVSLAPGEAIVAREGNAVFVAEPVGPTQEGFVDEALTLLARSAQGLAPMGSGLLRALAAKVVGAGPDDVPSLGLVTSTEDHLVVFLVGDMRIEGTSEAGEEVVVLGRDSTTFVERALVGPFQRLLLMGVGRDSEPDPRSNLSGGVVRGGGVLLTPVPEASEETDPGTLADMAPVPPMDPPVAVEPPPAAEPAAVPPPPPVEPEPAVEPPLEQPVEQPEPSPTPEFESISLLMPEDSPSLIEEEAHEHEEQEAHGVEVRGIVCSRGHFNDPMARFCSRCGISMVHQTHYLVSGIRPPLGVVVTDDGSVFALVTDYVLGREPDNDADVVAGDAVALPLEDAALLMSRVHARIRLEEWAVQVVDVNSANGTFVAEAADSEWNRLEPGVPVSIHPGARIRLGSRTLTFESHQRS